MEREEQFEQEEVSSDQPVRTTLTEEERNLFGIVDDEQEEVIHDDEEEVEAQDEEEQEEAPTTEQALAKLRIKYNGEEQELDEEKAREYAQKGMNYDKVAEKLRQQEAALDRIAKNQGFKDHADLVANLDKLEEQQHAQKQQEFTQYEQDLLYQLEQAGVDPEQAQHYLSNHPAIKAGREALKEQEEQRAQRESREKEERLAQGWVELLQTYPDLASEIQEGQTPSWLTEDMDKMINDGYKPIHAYRLVHSDAILEKQRKAAEQSVLKQQRLNKRSQVEREGKGGYQSQLSPDELAAAELFNINPKDLAKIK